MLDIRTSLVALACAGALALAAAASAQSLGSKGTDRPTAQPTDKAPVRADDKKAKSDPYTLGTCPVAGGKLDESAVTKVINGREVRFCCGGCVGKYEADLTTYEKNIDAAMAKQQMPYYPMTTCVVMGESLTEDGKDIGVNYMHNNRLYRVCCKMCIRKIKKDPAKYAKILDREVIKMQAKHYPMSECIVMSGRELEEGKGAQAVVGNRLVKFCCTRCEKKFTKDPVVYLTKLDAAWKKSHDTASDHGHDHSNDHAHDHDHSSSSQSNSSHSSDSDSSRSSDSSRNSDSTRSSDSDRSSDRSSDRDSDRKNSKNSKSSKSSKSGKSGKSGGSNTGSGRGG